MTEWIDRVQAVVTEAHEENRHRSGLRADAYLAAQLAVPGGPGAAACGAQDWGQNEDGSIHIYGTCQKTAGHYSDWHQEYRDGNLWAEWRGPHDRKAPCEN